MLQTAQNMQEKDIISVVLCSYNSVARLKPTIEALACQQLKEGVGWEFVFVDNASTDGSAEYVSQLWTEAKEPAPLRIVHEPQPGLIYARYAGVKHAKGSIVIFCDDDNWLQKDYLQRCYDLLTSHPNYGAVGGQGIAVSDVPLPEEWEKWQNDYACGKIANSSCVVDDIRGLFGAGLAVRAEVLKRVFSQPFVSVGRSGTNMASGDDTEICDRILLLGYSLFYDEDLVFRHYMPENRLSREYHDKLLKGFEKVYPMQKKYRLCIKFRKLTGKQLFHEFFVRIGMVCKLRNMNSLAELRDFLVFGFGWLCLADEESKKIYRLKL